MLAGMLEGSGLFKCSHAWHARSSELLQSGHGLLLKLPRNILGLSAAQHITLAVPVPDWLCLTVSSVISDRAWQGRLKPDMCMSTGLGWG